MPQETINVRFYYAGNVIKTSVNRPLPDNFLIPILNESTKKHVKFVYQFAVLEGGKSNEILFVVYRRKREDE